MKYLSVYLAGPMYRSARLLAAVLASSLLLVGQSSSQTLWNGTTGNWDDDLRWIGGLEPSGSDDAFINAGTVTITLAEEADEVRLGTVAGTAALDFVGGQLDSNFGRIGYEAGSDGTVTLTGGALWDNQNTLQVGRLGTGTLNISSGADVENFNAALGFSGAGNGTATVDGAGSTWTSDGFLIAGEVAQGTLNIQNGGVVTNHGFGSLGFAAGATGSVSVTGSGSTWTNTDSLFVGGSSTAAGGTGTLTTDLFGTVYVGDAAAAGGLAGRLTVSDSQSDPANGGRLVVYAGGTINHTGQAYLGLEAGEFGTAQVTGGGATWTNNSNLFVGLRGNGTLNIEDGGSVQNVGGFIGEKSGSTGTATVTGANSTWTNSNLFVGPRGNGTLNVEAGGAVSNVDGFIGWGSGSTGTVSVTGSGSTWTNTDSLFVGGSSTAAGGTGTLTTDGPGTVFVGDAAQAGGLAGRLTVSDSQSSSLNGGRMVVYAGGTINHTGQAFLGHEAGEFGTAEVTGSGATWTNTADLFVGVSGTGTLTVEAGGAVANTFGRIGNGINSTGTATVKGSNSTWTNTSVLSVGQNGAGTLNIAGGGAVESSSGYIGDGSSSTGTVHITGANSTWTNTSSLLVGRFGTGTLNIQFGGAVENISGIIGNGINTTGTATVTANSTWTNTGDLRVGSFGTGTLNIGDGGAVSNVNGFIGAESGSTGTATVTGSSSTWTSTDSLYVGGSAIAAGGTGTLTTDALGIVYVGDAAQAGGLAGRLTVSDSQTSGGRLVVYAGGTINHSGFAVLGDDAGEFGTAQVTGDGATWTNAMNLFVGDEGNGTLNVEDGGSVQNDIGAIGLGLVSTGTATVTGANSTWTNTGDLFVGNSGNGTLNIKDGGSVQNVKGIIGDLSVSTGTAMVTGANSTWTNTGDLLIGDAGTGTLNIEDGGSVQNVVGIIGDLSGSTGTAIVTGANSTWTITSNLLVGDAGNGMLNIEAGGAVSNVGGFIGRNPGSTGTATVTGTGSTWTHSSGLYVGGSDTAAGGTGTLNLLTGGTVDVSGPMLLWNTGTVNLNGGTLDAATIDHTNGGTFNFTDGTLIVDTFTGTLDQDGGTLAPGSSPGTTTISGDYNLNAGSLAIEIGGTTPGTEHDRVEVTGFADLQGDLDVTLIDGFTPAAGDSFGFLFANGGFNAGFSNLNLPDLSAQNLTWQLNPGGSTLFLDVIAALSLEGDYNADGFVSQADLDLVLLNWGDAVVPAGFDETAIPGGGPFDGLVSQNELDGVLLNWGAGTPPSANAIPEPTSGGLLAILGALMGSRKRRAA